MANVSSSTIASRAIAKNREKRLIGTPICRGIAIGHPFFYTLSDEIVPEYFIDADAIEEEIVRYQRALQQGCEDIKCLQKRLQKECVFDGAAILDAHLQIMQDPMLTTYVEEQIRITLKNADYIFQSVIKKYQKKFDSIADPFFCERFKDIKDISRRILNHLRNGVQVCLADTPGESVVFASDLTAFDTAEAKSGFVVAFVTQSGGATSHAAIVAKAKGIPYVSSVDFDSFTVEKD
ncbi:MAG TPA: phosphoenolpyruvate-utilizing N-terminal domain-containing protein, partial [Parachlamydiaceae bacterium]|nr:phosphoenolpyruvate-utilizing N-terminal domain-containing protein [Parachlamydiaceae bacterium]